MNHFHKRVGSASPGNATKLVRVNFVLILILPDTQSSTMDSNTLAAMGIREIGLMSLSTDLGGNFLGRGDDVCSFPTRRDYSFSMQ